MTRLAKTEYVIRFLNKPGFVAKFSAAHQCVLSATDPRQARRFRSAIAAQAFVEKYADAGYGLSKLSSVVEVAP